MIGNYQSRKGVLNPVISFTMHLLYWESKSFTFYQKGEILVTGVSLGKFLY